MKHSIWAATALAMTVAGAQEDLCAPLEQSYNAWHQAVARGDARTWERVSASHRKTDIRNRIVSETPPSPAAVFGLRTQPPALGGLKLREARRIGPTATDFVNPEVMNDVRAELSAGNLAYLNQTKQLQPSGTSHCDVKAVIVNQLMDRDG